MRRWQDHGVQKYLVKDKCRVKRRLPAWHEEKYVRGAVVSSKITGAIEALMRPLIIPPNDKVYLTYMSKVAQVHFVNGDLAKAREHSVTYVCYAHGGFSWSYPRDDVNFYDTRTEVAAQVHKLHQQWVHLHETMRQHFAAFKAAVADRSRLVQAETESLISVDVNGRNWVFAVLRDEPWLKEIASPWSPITRITL